MRATDYLCALIVALLLLNSASAQDEPAKYRDGHVPLENDLRLYYRVYGPQEDPTAVAKQSPLVFLHGGPGANFMGCGPDLIELSQRHTLVMYDQRGGGRSDPDPQAAQQTISTHVDDLESLRRHLKLERMTLIGHSFGATLAAYYTEKFPERVERLLLIGPMEPSRALLDERIAVEGELSRRVADKFAALEDRSDLSGAEYARARMDIIQSNYYFDPTKMKDRRGHYCDIPRDYFGEKKVIGDAVFASLGDYDQRPALEAFTIPVLIVEGAQSPLPLDGERAWAMAVPNARLWLLDQVGHGYPFVEAPDRFFPGVERFLDGHWPEGAQKLKKDKP